MLDEELKIVEEALCTCAIGPYSFHNYTMHRMFGCPYHNRLVYIKEDNLGIKALIDASIFGIDKDYTIRLFYKAPGIVDVHILDWKKDLVESNHIDASEDDSFNITGTGKKVRTYASLKELAYAVVITIRALFAEIERRQDDAQSDQEK